MGFALRLFLPLLGLALGPWLIGCASENDLEQTPVLDESHLGRKNQHCEICHSLPFEGHPSTDTSACAGCHGGNGACDPNGDQSAHQHLADDDCRSCHNDNHGYTDNASCASCHFAPLGLDPTCGIDPPDDGCAGADGGCGEDGADGGDLPGDETNDGGDPGSDSAGDEDPGPVLTDALESNCLNWPAQEFSPNNKTGTSTGLAGGQNGVEFTLMDTSGVPVTLSDLLRSKPVLMVFGAFT